jgi:hypothetical protein
MYRPTVHGAAHDDCGWYHGRMRSGRYPPARSSPTSHAPLWPSAVVPLGLLHARKGVGNRACSRWVTRDYRPLFPRLPEQTRLFRLFTTHQAWTQVFLAAPTVLGGMDTYNGLRVFRRAAAARIGHRRRQSRHTSRVRSAKCRGFRGTAWHTIPGIAGFFGAGAHAARPVPGAAFSLHCKKCARCATLVPSE